MEKLPIFIINGFLEAGKTQFMKFTMQQEYFQTDGNTLLIVCEEGEEEYSKELLDVTHTTVKYIDIILINLGISSPTSPRALQIVPIARS